MYRVLIVDDEAVIADGLHEVLDRLEELQLDVYSVYSGRDALEVMNASRIDIVITDICMPEMDGLELLEGIRGNWPQCRVIFLTGHNEFDYAYTALQYPDVRYLLKTEGYARIIETVRETIAGIDGELKMDSLIDDARATLGTVREMRRDSYFAKLLKGKLTRKDIAQSQFDEWELPLNAEAPVMLLIGRFDDDGINYLYSKESRRYYEINLITDHFFKNSVNYASYMDQNSNMLWFIQPRTAHPSPDGPDWQHGITFVKGYVELIQKSCRDSLHRTICYALDDTPVPWGRIPERYALLQMVLNYRFGRDAGMLIADSRIIDEAATGENRKREKLLSNRLRYEKLAEALEYGREEEFFYCFDEVTEDLRNCQAMHDFVALEIYSSISLVFLSFINRWNLTEELFPRAELYKLMNAESHSGWQQAVDYLKRTAGILFETIGDRESLRAGNVVGIIQGHIAEHLDDPDQVSLVRLAEIVHMNPSYLSRLFKQTAGVNLSQYIGDARLKKVKQLLAIRDMKICEAAAAVGYGTYSNFNRFFKKATAMTPQEYRDQILLEAKN